MNFSLKPYHIIAIFLPGFIFLFIICCSFKHWDFHKIIADCEHHSSLSIGFIAITLALFIGAFFDAFRNGYLEKQFDKKNAIYWDYFGCADEKEIENLYNRYYLWYIFDVNCLISLGLGFFITIGIYTYKIYWEGDLCRYDIFPWLLFTITAIFMFYILKTDAFDLRREVKKNIDNWEKKRSDEANKK